MRQKRRWLTFALSALVILSAAVYLYGGQFRVYLLMNKGRTYWQQGNLDQALLKFNQVLVLHANHPGAIDAIGLVYLTQGDLVRAEIKYEQAVKLGLRPNSRFNHAKLGDMYLARGLYAPAELEFRHSLDLSPRDAGLRLGHALTLHALGKVADAIDDYRQTLSLDPDAKLAQTQLNQARQELERGFVYYIFDRAHSPLARFSILRQGGGQRYYPLLQYAAHLVGYQSAEHGSAGLEKALAPYLPGNAVTLTINADWQRAADRALGWRKGALVALNPQTGEILTVVNHPSYNPNRLDEDWDKIVKNKNQPLKNRATEGLYEPGSIFKIITAAAAHETSLDLKRIFPINCTGGTRYGNTTFWCWKRHGQVESIQSALDTSCNVAMAEVGFALGPDRMYEYANRFGFGAPLTFPFKSELLEWSFPIATSVAPIAKDTRFDQAEFACGLGEGTLISPLHAAMLAAAIANQGKMMAPYFIKEIRNIRGEVLAVGSPQLLRTPITPATAEIVKGYMIDTVKHGIGSRAQVEGVTVAGKTGTTGDSLHGLNGWFICFAPAENPTVAVAVYAEKEGAGMDVATPIAHAFLQDILK
ncbi:MAG: tetratricopeptide repeat protein [Candidatus Firestonebacteria bacterium]|nr:tetratricopeptide repeat protein [Candidatus Firestonebacteria bacterium]